MKANVVLSIITIVFSIFFLIQSLKLPFGTSTNIGAGGWPTIILILLLFMGLFLLVKSLVQMKAVKRAGHHEQTVTDEKESFEPDVVFPYKHWITSIIILLYLIAISVLGFVVATPLFIFIMALIMGMRHWGKLAATSLISSALFIYVFTILLSIPLPRGVGIFRSISLIFY